MERRLRQSAMIALLIVAAGGAGCAAPGPGWGGAGGLPAANPLFVVSNNEDAVWERTVEVLHAYYFGIARENRLARVIETDYVVGSGVLEPWRRDSVGLANRLESTFQSIRRRAIVNVLPDEQQRGYLVSVEVFKEIEDLPGIAANSAGAATFSESTPLDRDLNPVVGQSAPSGWIPLGRDLALESSLLASLQAAYSRP